jgi:amidase/aspartyl-tRNA(Asn)/glutamyl-tRNA(Gln) amidotransferase subunit A
VPGGGAPTNGGANTNPHNVTGHPAISVPAGMLPTGLPFGLLLTAPRWRDDFLLRLAAAWEAIAPWPRAAPGYAPFSGD